MIIRRYVDGDIEKINLQNEQIHEAEGVKYPEETSFTLEDQGKVVGVFGFVEGGGGRGIVFSFISRDAGPYMLKMARKLKHLIDDGMSKTNIERLEITVLESFDHGKRFAELLGFECEGVMRKYYKGKDYKLYARVR